MFCNKCGRLIEENTEFCSGCGTAIPIKNSMKQKEDITSNMPQSDMNFNKNNESFVNSGININNCQSHPNHDKATKSSMKKYAIFSVVIPIVSIFIYWNIGLASYVAILLAILGFHFAKKGRMYNKTLSTTGYILNSILVATAIFMFFTILLENS